MSVYGERPRRRQLALALWNHSDLVDGVRYRSCRNDDEYGIALFDRASDALIVDSTENLIADSARLANAVDLFNVGITT